MFERLFINQFSYFTPPADSPTDAPKLDYVDPLFRRRLSQLSRMTIEVVHRLTADADGKPTSVAQAKIVFASFRGEIARQVKINRSLVDDYDILPAPFSLSVFNTPPAAATIALGIKNGYTAVYPGELRFYDAFVAAAAPVLAGSEARVIFVYADECIPGEYQSILRADEQSAAPLAFAAVLSAEKTAAALPVSQDISTQSPADFLAYLLAHGTPTESATSGTQAGKRT